MSFPVKFDYFDWAHLCYSFFFCHVERVSKLGDQLPWHQLHDVSKLKLLNACRAENSRNIAQMFESPNLEILIPCFSAWVLPGKTSMSTGALSHHLNVNHLRYFLTCFCLKDPNRHSMTTTPTQKVDRMAISLTRSFLVALVSEFGSAAISISGSSSFARSAALLTEDAASGMNVMHVVPSHVMKLQPINLTLLALSIATHPIITLGLRSMGQRGTWLVRRPKRKVVTRGSIGPGSQGLRKWGSKGSSASDVRCCCPGELKARSMLHKFIQTHIKHSFKMTVHLINKQWISNEAWKCWVHLLQSTKFLLQEQPGTSSDITFPKPMEKCQFAPQQIRKTNSIHLMTFCYAKPAL